MFCPNGHLEFVIGPEYTTGRGAAIMTCLQCGTRFDAYATAGLEQKPVRKAA
jgi:hypothetical protein